MFATCSAPKRGHRESGGAATCPAHGRVAQSRSRAGLPPAKESGLLFSGGDLTLRHASRPARGLRVDGDIRLENDSRAYDCINTSSLSADQGSYMENCHSVLIDDTDRQEDLTLSHTNRWVDVNGEGSVAVNCSGGVLRVGGRHCVIADCHADGDILLNGYANAISGTTAGGVWFIGREAHCEIAIDQPGQALVQDAGGDDWLTGVGYDPAVTFVFPMGHQWAFLLYATSNRGGYADGADGRSERGVSARREIVARRAVVTRPRDGSGGRWIDARNEDAWRYLSDHIGADGLFDDDQVAIASALFPNP